MIKLHMLGRRIVILFESGIKGDRLFWTRTCYGKQYFHVMDFGYERSDVGMVFRVICLIWSIGVGVSKKLSAR